MSAASHSREFERFVGAVHRRMTLFRALERVGLCVLGGCGVAAALAPILMTRGEPTGSLILAALGAAVVAGLFWGTLSRPTRLAAATEADRQLRLADLLGTAVTLRAGGSDDGMAGAVLALADARCRGTSPAAVVLNRFGARGWGGIGLALAFVAGLNLLGPEPTRSAQGDHFPAASWRDGSAGIDGQRGRAAGGAREPDLRRAKAGGGSDDSRPLPADVPDDRSPPTSAAQATGSADQRAGGGSPEGSGAGAGQSTSGKPEAHPITAKALDAQNALDKGTAAGGGGAGTVSGTVSGGAQAGTAAGAAATANRRPAPVWESKGWADDRGAAEAAVRSGRVPEAYRDLVRGYFKQD